MKRLLLVFLLCTTAQGISMPQDYMGSIAAQGLAAKITEIWPGPNEPLFPRQHAFSGFAILEEPPGKNVISTLHLFLFSLLDGPPTFYIFSIHFSDEPDKKILTTFSASPYEDGLSLPYGSVLRAPFNGHIQGFRTGIGGAATLGLSRIVRSGRLNGFSIQASPVTFQANISFASPFASSTNQTVLTGTFYLLYPREKDLERWKTDIVNPLFSK